LLNAKDVWMPAVDSLVNGDGSAVIDSSMLAEMDRVFDHFRTFGGRSLRRAIDENYALLGPRDFEGRTIGELAAHWAALAPPPTVFDDGFDES